MLQFLGDSKCQRASKLHYWFKSYGNFFLKGWICLYQGQSKHQEMGSTPVTKVLQSTEATTNGSNDKRVIQLSPH